MLSHQTRTAGYRLKKEPKALPPPPVNHPSVPTPDRLAEMPWCESVWSTYQGLIITADRLAAMNYLALQWRLDFDPAYSRTVRLTKEESAAIREAVTLILNPYQQPLTADCLNDEITRYGLTVTCSTLKKTLSKLVEQQVLRQFKNPFRGRQLVYCNEMYRAEPARGDRVVELIRRSSQREGTITRFRRYMDGRLYPVALWDEVLERKGVRHSPAFESFANPDMLFVVGRSEPFAARAAA